MTKSAVVIEHEPGEPMMEHCLAAWQGFKWLGYNVHFVRSENIQKALLPPDTRIPFVGSTEGTRRYLERHRFTAPAPLNVPEQLLKFAGRQIVSMTLKDFLDFAKLPAFVKPAETAKLWTGGVVSSENTKCLFAEYDPKTPVLVSPEVQFESEYRVFVSRTSGIVAMKHYAGDPFVVADRWKINQMIAAYKDAPRCYSLDVGVIGKSEAETVIVECNDFWALGTYGMDPVKYAELLAFRWHEMILNA